MRIQGARHTVSWLLDSEKPGGLGSSTRGALSLSVKSIAHGLPIASRAPLAAALDRIVGSLFPLLDAAQWLIYPARYQVPD